MSCCKMSSCCKSQTTACGFVVHLLCLLRDGGKGRADVQGLQLFMVQLRKTVLSATPPAAFIFVRFGRKSRMPELRALGS